MSERLREKHEWHLSKRETKQDRLAFKIAREIEAFAWDLHRKSGVPYQTILERIFSELERDDL